jgi:hypothetical protein
MHGNMQAARRLVNGGTNGLDRFTDAYNIGDSLMTSGASSGAPKSRSVSALSGSIASVGSA